MRDIFGNDQIGAGDHKIIGLFFSAVVYTAAMLMEIISRVFSDPPAQHGVSSHTHFRDPLRGTVAVKGSEIAVKFTQMPGDFDHHTGLIQCAADEQYLF